MTIFFSITHLAYSTLRGALVFCGLAVGGGASAKEVEATTADGQVVILSSDHTWKEKPAGKASGDEFRIRLSKLEMRGNACYAFAELENLSKFNFENFWPDIAFFDREGVQVALETFQFSSVGPRRTVRKDAIVAFNTSLRCNQLTKALVTSVRTCSLFSGERFGDCLDAVTVAPGGALPMSREGRPAVSH